MTSIVSDFILNPVLRQARRFSRSSLASEPDSATHQRPLQEPRPGQDEVISETEEDSYLMDEPDATISSSASSTSSVPAAPCPNPTGNAQDHDPIDATVSSSRDPTAPYSTNPTIGSSNNIDVPTSSRSVLSENLTTGMASIRAEGSESLPQVAPSNPLRRDMLPEDDGMGDLRRRILLIQVQDLPPSDKARRMHQLLMEGYAKAQSTSQFSRPLTPSSPAWEQPVTQGPLESLKAWQSALTGEPLPEKFLLTEEDIRPTFVPKATLPDGERNAENQTGEEYPVLGCEHYRRNVKLQCSTCKRWYTCRFCHDKVEDHALVRKETKNMLCMVCGTAQKAGESCANCGETTARYYCNVCKLWDDGPDKNIYHCSDCGICRIGRGIGKDFFHCKKCCACIAISMKDSHKCIERVTDCDCPICGDYMFTSPKAVVFMLCGHSIHRNCFEEHMKSSYRCPICNKSVTNMETQFRGLDIAIQQQPMPAEFQDTRAVILCNDCSAKSSCRYHWLGLKCAICHSYNTVQLQITGSPSNGPLPDPISERPAAVPDRENTEISVNEEPAAPRDIPPPRRRHSSDLLVPTAHGVIARLPDFPTSYTVADRMVRSVSPPAAGPLFSHAVGNRQAANVDLTEEDERADILGFWSRVPRSITSDDDGDDEIESEDESDSAMDEDEDPMEDDEEEEEEISLFGHR